MGWFDFYGRKVELQAGVHLNGIRELHDAASCDFSSDFPAHIDGHSQNCFIIQPPLLFCLKIETIKNLKVTLKIVCNELMYSKLDMDRTHSLIGQLNISN